MARKSLFDLRETGCAGEQIARLSGCGCPTARFEQAAGIDTLLVSDSPGTLAAFSPRFVKEARRRGRGLEADRDGSAAYMKENR
jgi:hypothetical protein